jgi:hypothetical protein
MTLRAYCLATMSCWLASLSFRKATRGSVLATAAEEAPTLLFIDRTCTRRISQGVGRANAAACVASDSSPGPRHANVGNALTWQENVLQIENRRRLGEEGAKKAE